MSSTSATNDEHRYSWLAPTPLARERVLERAGAVDSATRISSLLGIVVLIWTAIDINLWALLPAAAIVAVTSLGTVAIKRGLRPEYTDFVSGLILLAALGIGAGLTGGPSSPIVFMLPVGLVIDALRGVPAGTVAGTGVLCMVFLATSLLADFQAVVDEPLPMFAILTSLVSIAAVAITLSSAEIRYRKAAVLDPLTGLLNRQALEARFEEVRQQAILSDAPISLILFDLDHFKRVNDEYGHDVGDAVLRDVAYEVRKSLRQFELAYRIGGEEFLVVLPGMTEHQAEGTAEQLRSAVERSDGETGIGITASFGVCGASGDAVQFETLYRRADEALYTAKRMGRDRVCARESIDAPRRP
jgi:diguanylate cyclase (GGDEF)-like protein